MSQQTLDFRTSIKAVRRHSKVFTAIAVLGLLAGAAYAVLRPPLLTSTALVVLPQIVASQSTEATNSGATDNEIATQVVIASSYPVLARALPHVSPPMSLQTLQGRVQVVSMAGSIISVSAKGASAAQAEATANAVASSYISYVTSKNSPVGRVPAKMLESANTATGSKLPTQIAIDGLIGLIGGAVVGFIVSLAMSVSDRRLVERDAIANSIGAPVLASIPVGHPSDAASWVKLLEEYEPGVVHAWGLTKMLQQLGVADLRSGKGGRTGESASLTVLSLASDPSALALGPQVAAFAAARGIPTTLVLGPLQDANVAATLRTACAAPPQSREGRRPLHLTVAEHDDFLHAVDGDEADRFGGASFVVVVTVVDGRAPLMPHAAPTTATVLGVSAGGATAEQLARAATAIAAHGDEVMGILVADPDPADHSTGRIPHLAPPSRRQMPTRVNDVPTEINR